MPTRCGGTSGWRIAPDDLERIFEPFVQVPRADGDVGQGIGLGLSISRDLARAMGGDITVESTVGKGSTFTVELPAGTEANKSGPSIYRLTMHPMLI